MKVPDLFVPKSYYTPVSYLKENMPLWIGIDDDRCIVTYLTKNYDQDNQALWRYIQERNQIAHLFVFGMIRFCTFLKVSILQYRSLIHV